MKQFYVVPINDAEFSLNWSPSTLNVGCMYFRYIHSDGRYGSAGAGVSGPKEGEEGEQRHSSGSGEGGRGHLGKWRGGGTQYRNTVRKIGNYRSTVSKIDEIPIPHLFSVTLT